MAVKFEGRRRDTAVFVCLVGALWLVCTALFIQGAVEGAQTYRTHAAVDATTVGRYVDVGEHNCGRWVEYTVAGRDYRLDTKSGRHICSDAAEGEQIEVRYDSSNPATSHRGATSPTGGLVAAAVNATTAFGLFVAPIIWWRRSGRRTVAEELS